MDLAVAHIQQQEAEALVLALRQRKVLALALLAKAMPVDQQLCRLLEVVVVLVLLAATRQVEPLEQAALVLQVQFLDRLFITPVVAALEQPVTHSMETMVLAVTVVADTQCMAIMTRAT